MPEVGFLKLTAKISRRGWSRNPGRLNVYSYALKVAKIDLVYSTAIKGPGILICPTRFPKATLYVLASESNQSWVSFRGLRSGREFSGMLANGRAAPLFVGTDGKLLATNNWPGP